VLDGDISANFNGSFEKSRQKTFNVGKVSANTVLEGHISADRDVSFEKKQAKTFNVDHINANTVLESFWFT